jgi:hypothetical protein
MTNFHGPDDIDRRISDALRAAAGQVDEHSLRPALAPRASSMAPRRHVRWTAPLLAAAAVVAVVATTVAVTSSSNSSAPRRIPVGSGLPASTSERPDASASDLPLSTSPAYPSPGRTTDSPSEFPSSTVVPDYACPFADVPCKTLMRTYYAPIWPFTTYDEARQWQGDVAKSGSQPWHGDAVATATSYVQNVLGFTDLTVFRMLGPSGTNGAHVQVGWVRPDKVVVTAAVLHLVRYGAASGDVLAPWEVVGTDDDTLSLTSPAYRSAHTSPLTVGGLFTGVDGNLVVSVRDTNGGVLGTAPGLPAGGEAPPWKEQVSYLSTGRNLCVVVVFAGGALIQHSQFAIQPFYG